MPQKLKVGIIGVGAIGTVHADAYQATGAAEIAAACDVDAEKLDRQCDRFGVSERCTKYQQLLETDVDAVSVCVGNALHKEVAVAALQAGKHVLLEKPMALNATEARAIAAEAAKAKGILQMGMVRRQHPEPQIVREYVDAGLFGEVYHMRAVLIRRRGIPGLGGWFTTRAESGGGPMIDLGVHWFDLVMWLSGHWKPTRVSARTYAKFGPNMKDYKYVGMWAGPPRYDGTFDVEDYSTGFARFDDVATMSFEIAWAANAQEESYVEILGTEGGARIGDGRLEILTEHNGRLADIAPKYDRKVNGFEVQARKFLAACRGEQPPAATAEQGVAVMSLIDAIYASSDANAEVDVNL